MAKVFPTLGQSIIELNAEQRQDIAKFSQKHAFYPYSSDTDFELFMDKARMLSKRLPTPVLESLHQFRCGGNADGVLVIRGLSIDEKRIGLTPKHWSLGAQEKRCYETEMYLIGISSLLGEVFAFRTQHEGNIVQNILPTQEDRHEQVGTGSETFLEWHTEDAFHRLRADFIGLLCLRSDPAAATTFASLKHIQMPDCYKGVLFSKKFQAGIDKAHKGSGRAEDGPVIAIFSGPYDDPYLRVDTSCISALPREPEAQMALDYLICEMSRVAQQIVLQQGDLLFIDNHRVVHGRTSFTPRFDGTDRWLQRVSIACDFQKSSPTRTKQLRVIEIDLQFIG